MGKETDNTIADDDDFEPDGEAEEPARLVAGSQKDMRRRLEDKLDEVRLGRMLKEYDFRDF